MKLLLTSSGLTNKSIKKTLLELLGKPFEKSHLVFVPTAANPEEGDKSWLIDDLHNFRKLQFASIDIIDIAAIPKAKWLARFKKADILVFGGGDTNYLLDHIRKSGLEEILKSLLKTKIYVGISAGSMVTARNVSLSIAGILYYEKTGGFKNKTGLGFVDFELRPHLNSNWFPKVKLAYLKKLAEKVPYSFYAIDDDTALKVINGEVSVISEGDWKKFN